MGKKLILPNYKNCIANLPNSILKKFGVQPVGATLPLLDKYLVKEYKNIVVLLLDGLGKTILERHLKKDGAFRTHLAGIYQSVFPSSTVPATTSIMSGLQPCEHSWLGWECYYPQIDKNVIPFLNKDQKTGETAADFNVAWTYTPYETVFDKINNVGKKAYLISPFAKPSTTTIEGICDKIEELCKTDDQKYIYAYWSEPDGLLHRNGLEASVVHETIVYLEELVTNLTRKLEDTLFIVTADHGHIDNEYVVLEDYPNLLNCLVRIPSIEPRAINFFVKDGKQDYFEKEFKKEFEDKFILMPMDEALQLFGTGVQHKNFRSMLGNYLAIAVNNLTIYYDESRWVSMHGGLTEEEMLIPLIVF